MKSNTYCILADLGLATQTNGNMTICNQSRTEFRDKNGSVLRLDKNSLLEGWNSPTRQEIRQALLNGIPHDNCRECWAEEAAGRTSIRMQAQERFNLVEPLESQPRVFMFKPGNLCNLSCRHCNPYVSSKWYRDHYQVEIKPKSNISFVDYAHQYDSIRDSFAEGNSNLWPVLEQWNDCIIFYDLYGAEPLLIEPLLDQLRDSVRSGASQRQTIHINTNGTIWHDDFAELFSSFQRIELGVSIDGIEQQFDYMRYPAQWNRVLDNLKKYQQIEKLHPERIHLEACITISLLNVYYVKEYVKFFHSMGIHCGINLVHQPDYLNLRIASPKVKQAIIEHLNSQPFSSRAWNEKIQNIINFINLDFPNSEKLMQQFWEFTNKYDELRSQRYAEIFPEFYKVLINE